MAGGQSIVNFDLKELEKENEKNGIEKYKRISYNLLGSHVALQVLYIVIGCVPMIYINILSIICYIVSIRKAEKDIIYSLNIMIWEVYIHAILATIFFGVEAGFILWLFSIYSSIFLPNTNKLDKNKYGKQLIYFGIIVSLTFFTLIAIEYIGLTPEKYRFSENMARIAFCINGLVVLLGIKFYSTIYTDNMNSKNEKLQEIASHDFLTGIYNRQRIEGLLLDRIEQELNQEKPNIYVAMLDVDFFKVINDDYGHLAGDYVLKEIASMILENRNDILSVGRWGGEEFLIVNTDNQSFDAFYESLEIIRKAIAERQFVFDSKAIKVTVSIGATDYIKGENAEDTIKRVDDNLYRAKEEGRNRTIC